MLLQSFLKSFSKYEKIEDFFDFYLIDTIFLWSEKPVPKYVTYSKKNIAGS